MLRTTSKAPPSLRARGCITCERCHSPAIPTCTGCTGKETISTTSGPPSPRRLHGRIVCQWSRPPPHAGCTIPCTGRRHPHAQVVRGPGAKVTGGDPPSPCARVAVLTLAGVRSCRRRPHALVVLPAQGLAGGVSTAIPTRAGCTVVPAAQQPQLPRRPHARGLHSAAFTKITTWLPPSPRARVAHVEQGIVVSEGAAVPTRAGCTLDRPDCFCLPDRRPHARGLHVVTVDQMASSAPPSPRARVALDHPCRRPCRRPYMRLRRSGPPARS